MTKARENSDYTGLQGDLALKSPVASPSFTGNVGIGTASPATLVHLQSSSSKLRVEETGGSYVELEAGGAAGYVSTKTGHPLIFKPAGTQAMRIDAAGIVTKPLQPAFSLSKTSDQTIPSDTETTVSFQTEAFDVNSDCTSGVFTAPVDGTYVFYFQVRFNAPNRSANYLDVRIITSGRPYKTLKDFGGYSSSAYETMESTIITQMDAGDTASPAVYVSSGTQVVSSDATRTHFSGYLLG